jgi:hypothetical protein
VSRRPKKPAGKARMKNQRAVSAWNTRKTMASSPKVVVLAWATRLYSPAPTPIIRRSRVRNAPSPAVQASATSNAINANRDPAGVAIESIASEPNREK